MLRYESYRTTYVIYRSIMKALHLIPANSPKPTFNVISLTFPPSIYLLFSFVRSVCELHNFGPNFWPNLKLNIDLNFAKKYKKYHTLNVWKLKIGSMKKKNPSRNATDSLDHQITRSHIETSGNILWMWVRPSSYRNNSLEKSQTYSQLWTSCIVAFRFDFAAGAQIIRSEVVPN